MATVLLSFHRARVPSYETGFFQRRTKLRIGQHECPGNPVADGTCLARATAAFNIYLDIKTRSCLRDVEGLQDNHSRRLTAKVFLQGAAVDRDEALALL